MGRDVALHQSVEEMPERRDGLIFGLGRAFHLTDMLSRQTRRDAVQLQPAFLSPVQKTIHDPAVSPPPMRMLIVALRNSS